MAFPFVTAPPTVRACALGPVTVLLDTFTGRVETLLGPAVRLWVTLSACGDVATAAREVRNLDPGRLYQLVDDLIAEGLLVATHRPLPWPAPADGVPTEPSWGTRELSAQPEPPGVASRKDMMLPGLALALILAARRFGRAESRFARLLRLVECTAPRGRRPASPEAAERAVNAVRRVARLFPARVACLEESIAVALVLAARGQRVTWCHGVAADPIRFHAWMQTEGGQRVGEPPESDRYTPLIEIPALRRSECSTRRR